MPFGFDSPDTAVETAAMRSPALFVLALLGASCGEDGPYARYCELTEECSSPSFHSSVTNGVDECVQVLRDVVREATGSEDSCVADFERIQGCEDFALIETFEGVCGSGTFQPL